MTTLVFITKIWRQKHEMGGQFDFGEKGCVEIKEFRKSKTESGAANAANDLGLTKIFSGDGKQRTATDILNFCNFFGGLVIR